MAECMRNESINHENSQQRSLLRKSMTQFVVCVAVLFVVATPLFYWLTKSYYAEDMADLVEAVQAGRSWPVPDLERDIMVGIMIQYVLITVMLGVGVVLTMRFISRKLWAPFDETLDQIEAFSLESGSIPTLPMSDIKEFNRLNDSLRTLMHNSLDSYKAQKEFTENASHELQTPLAIFQSKLDLLLQQQGLTESQAEIIQDLCLMTTRLSRLNRNLLLLAKIENAQFAKSEAICLNTFVDDMLPFLKSIAGGLHIITDFQQEVVVKANRSLLESMLNNLVVNAVRHNRRDGSIVLSVKADSLTVSNTSDEPALEATHIFNRFYRPAQNKQGNGLGLAIVKAVCDYHGWSVTYTYTEGKHCFSVNFQGNYKFSTNSALTFATSFNKTRVEQ